MKEDLHAKTNTGIYPVILRGREGRMNGQIIRYLALNGPSLIYSVAKDLVSRSQTKVHYPTVNRRTHELVRREYVQRAGTKITKAGTPADLYATTLRGDFAAVAGMPDSFGYGPGEMSPKELRQMIANASFRESSPFVLLGHMLEEGAVDLVDKELVPEIIKAVRNGYLNLDALDDGVICSAFASLISSKVTAIMDVSSHPKGTHQDYLDTLMRSLERTLGSDHPIDKAQRSQNDKTESSSRLNVHLSPVPHQWGSELKVFLRLHSVRSY